MFVEVARRDADGSEDDDGMYEILTWLRRNNQSEGSIAGLGETTKARRALIVAQVLCVPCCI